MFSSCFVLNLPDEITEPDLRRLLWDDAIVAVTFRDLPSGTSAMLEFLTVEEAERAMAELRRVSLSSKPLIVIAEQSPLAWQVAALFSNEEGEEHRACGTRRAYDACLLLVDDDPMCLQVMQRLLSMHMPSVCVHLARSGDDAVTLNRTREFDVILSDVQMPGLDGISLIAEVHRLRPDTPVILMTGNPDVRSLMAESGAFAFVRKPVSRQYCVLALQHAIAYSALCKTKDTTKDALSVAEHQESIKQWNLVGDGPRI